MVYSSYYPFERHGLVVKIEVAAVSGKERWLAETSPLRQNIGLEFAARVKLSV